MKTATTQRDNLKPVIRAPGRRRGGKLKKQILYCVQYQSPGKGRRVILKKAQAGRMLEPKVSEEGINIRERTNTWSPEAEKGKEDILQGVAWCGVSQPKQRKEDHRP